MTPLESSRLFTDLPNEHWELVKASVELRKVPAGTAIFREGEIGDGVYVVHSGLVEISAGLDQETGRALAKVSPGDFFGEMAVLDKEPRSATATSKLDTEVYFVPRE